MIKLKIKNNNDNSKTLLWKTIQISIIKHYELKIFLKILFEATTQKESPTEEFIALQSKDPLISRKTIMDCICT